MSDLQTQVDALVARLRPHGTAIGEAAAAGDADAKNVVSLYQMVSSRAEPACVALCGSALDTWLAKKR